MQPSPDEVAVVHSGGPGVNIELMLAVDVDV
jgi:hypothetical protein